MGMRSLAVSLLCMAMPVLAAGQARDTHENLNAVLWMQTSAEYQVLAEQTYKNAWEKIQARLAMADAGYGVPSAAVEQPGFNTRQLPYAVIMDIDETVLDNSPMSGRLVETRRGYSHEVWSDWVEKEAAEFIPGAEEFINKARGVRIEVIFVTNRGESEEAHTIADLRPLPVSGEQILMPGEVDQSSGQVWTSEKSQRRACAAEKYWIIGMVGDDLGDFIPAIRSMPHDQRVAEARKHQAKFGEQWFLLPNPVYGSWESSLYDRKDSDQRQLEDKMKRVESFQSGPAAPPARP